MEGFQLFGPGHLAALAYTVAVGTLGIAAARSGAGRAVPISLAALIAAGQLFTPVIESLFGEMSIRHCARLFEQFGISHAPVLENDQVIGIISYYLLVLGGLDLD